jgi:hypothetical protein
VWSQQSTLFCRGAIPTDKGTTEVTLTPDTTEINWKSVRQTQTKRALRRTEITLKHSPLCIEMRTPHRQTQRRLFDYIKHFQNSYETRRYWRCVTRLATGRGTSTACCSNKVELQTRLCVNTTLDTGKEKNCWLDIGVGHVQATNPPHVFWNCTHFGTSGGVISTNTASKFMPTLKDWIRPRNTSVKTALR